SRRNRVRPSSSSWAASCPANRIEPWKPPSRRPTACSRVDLPEPDGPRSATISPGFTSRLTPRRTSMVVPPWVKLRLRSRVTSAASLIAKHLDRIGVRRPTRREQGRREDQQHGNDQNCGDLERIGL